MTVRLALALLAGALLAATGCRGGEPSPVQAPSPAQVIGPALAPYLDATLEPPPGLLAAMTGRVRQVRLAFVTAGPGCEPHWGDRPVDDPAVLALAGRLRRAGVQPVPSFGGAHPAEPALACPTAEALADLYGTVLAAFGATALDLDLEGRALTDRAAVDRRNAAVRLLRERVPAGGTRPVVTWTVPAGPSGPTPEAVTALRAARAAEALPDRLDVMAMNLGTGSAGPEAVRPVVAGAVRAVRALRPELSAAQAAAAVGVVLMIGRNDLPGEALRPADAARVAADARAAGLAGLSFWSLNRDRPCPSPAPAQASASCSGVQQRPGDFLRALSVSETPMQATALRDDRAVNTAAGWPIHNR